MNSVRSEAYSLGVGIGLLVVGGAVFGAACGSSAATSDAPLRNPTDGGATDAQDGFVKDADWCEALGAKMDRCDKTRECDSKFSLWCPLQAKTNSRAFELADTICLGTTCLADDRNDCRYRRYEESMLSASQRQLLEAACGTCANPASCKDSILHYDATKGPKSVSDIYVAVWELADPIADELRARCTGVVPDAGDCAKAFGQCSVDLYLAALPECPR